MVSEAGVAVATDFGGLIITLLLYAKMGSTFVARRMFFFVRSRFRDNEHLRSWREIERFCSVGVTGLSLGRGATSSSSRARVYVSTPCHSVSCSASVAEFDIDHEG